MSSPQNTLRLGLVDLPTLTAPLSAAGFALFGGGPFREAAGEIKAAAEQGPVAAIFVADTPQPGIKAWLTRMTTHGSVVVILRGDLPRLEVDGARSVDLPATVGELLAAAGLTAVAAADAAVNIDVDGAVKGAGAPASEIPASAAAVEAPALAKTGSTATKATATKATATKVQPVEAVSAAVQASPILFADRRREAHPPTDEAADDALFVAPDPTPPAVASPATATSPWDDEAPAAAPDAVVPEPVGTIAPPAAGPVTGPASPWDEDYPAAAEPEPYVPAPVAREEDWFGPATAPSRASEPAVAAPARQQLVRVAQSPHDASKAHSEASYAGSCTGPQYADPTVGPFTGGAPVSAPTGERQPVANQDHPWGQPAASVAVLPTPTKHDVPEPFFTAPAPAQPDHAQPGYAQPDPVEPGYAQPEYQQPAAQPAYDPTPAYVDPQDAVDAMFAAAAPPEAPQQVQAPRRIRGHGGPLAIICAEKGGVGKTNTTLALAQRAADLAPGKRVVLVDMNRGQGDIRKYLKLGGAQVPSILDAAISGNIAEAVLSPDQVTAARHSSLPPISFGVVLAPEPEAADPRIVTPDVYQRVIDLVRDQADLVFVDTQIIEIHDTSGLVDGLIVPALAHDAFGVTLTDTSAPGVSNLVTMLGYFAQQGVPSNRLMIVINRALAGYDTNVLRGMLQKYGIFAGAVEEKSLLARQANMGRIPHNDPSLAPVLDSVLLRITGWPCFQPAAPVTSKKRLFAGFGRKAKN